MNPGVQHPKIHNNHWNVERHRALPPPSSAHISAFEDPSQTYPAVTDSYPTSGGPYKVSPAAKRVRISGVLASSSSAAGWATGQQHGQAHDAELGPAAETDPGRAPKSGYREKNDHDITVKKTSNATPRSGGGGGGGTTASSSSNVTASTNNKSRRVRTGCLTCRGRHLKCDEAFPECNNCRKSCRECKRGLRLNFIDTRVKSPPFVPPTLEWSVQFQDESRLIASEYQGGLGRYPRLDQNTVVTPPHETELNAALRVVVAAHKKQDAGAGKTYRQTTTDNDVAPIPPPGLGEQQHQQDVVDHGSGAAAASGLMIKLSPDQPTYDGSQLFQPQNFPLRNDSDNPYTMRVKICQQYTTKDGWASQTHSYRRRSEVSSAVSSFPQHDHRRQSIQQTVSSMTYGLQPSQPQHAPEVMTISSTTKPTPSKKPVVERDYLSTDIEIHLMQVFITEIAPWMDILNKDKQFVNMMPDLALKSPMLLNALLACGTMHLSLTQQPQPQQHQRQASQPSGNSSNVKNTTSSSSYYELATMELWRNLEQQQHSGVAGSSSDRNAAECATTATVLNAYDIMSSGGNPCHPSPPLSRSQRIHGQQQGQLVVADPNYHIAGCARALVKECGWNTNSMPASAALGGTGHGTGTAGLVAAAGAAGIGEACFWFNACMEVLSCLQPGLVMQMNMNSMNSMSSMSSWQQQTPTPPSPTPTVWDPDQWGLDTSVDRWTTTAASNPTEGSSLSVSENDGQPFGVRRVGGYHGGSGEEELWAQRILYALAKVINFCAANNNSVSRYQETSPHDEQMRLQRRFTEWKSLSDMCDAWRSNCPRPMRPYGYAHSSSSGSLFPNVWLTKRPALVARLFYHVAMCILAQVNPVSPRDSEPNRELQQHHARQVCGIAAHNKDRAVTSIVTRCVATVGGVLSDRAEQSEALAILERISTEAGWRLGDMLNDMKKAWGWTVEEPTGASHSNNNAGAGSFASTLLGAGQQQSTLELPLPLPSRPPSISQLFGTSSSHGQHPLPQPSSTTRTSSSTAATTSYSNSPTIPNLTASAHVAAHSQQTYSATPSASSRRQSRQGPSPPPPSAQNVGVTSQQAYQGWYQQPVAPPQSVRTSSVSSQQHMGGSGAAGPPSNMGWG
ncbi:hypothetical protein B0T20DRAFT_352584 [Sordaria brevicollis]|uniref:Zn(2)-C6 fungal-type domain-containing protein n=1 Tax=Sordaria brevicollis TaxID=83679 RepID=A0AAE0PEF3_SORBR|nr:hypothetical protein B0T20DRAFT_352584 [Sordaria brevicollis]